MLKAQQFEQYRQEGYVHVPGVVPQEVLDGAREVLEEWVDTLADHWIAEGRLENRGEQFGFTDRLLQLWHKAGQPTYSRSPRRDLVGPAMYRLLAHPALLDLAAGLLGTDEILVHGIFNARPKLPAQKWTDTPWHQDAQYYRDAESVHVVSIWFPLQDVDQTNSCMKVAPRQHKGVLFADYHDEETGFKGIDRQEWDQLPGKTVPMAAGDALCFTQLTPHRALPNQTQAVRWSMDFRYEALATATESGLRMGFVGRSRQGATACREWLAKWEGMGWGQY
ncbi:MAG: hypothetical protein GKR89_16020 [Candidatus Latescibacteria bacterium]|nr:hypothetical protein [Candidatus Latescibacterota bacterium]